MFGNKNKDATRAFEAAKDATRRASFLNVASELSDGGANKQDLAMLFRVCRASALAAGEAVGKSQHEVDAEISALCDADIKRLKKAGERAVQQFGEESHKIASAYLAGVNPEALAVWTQMAGQPTRH